MGKKFDIRNYVLIACTDPMFILYRPGHFRISYEEFDLDIS